MLRNTTLIPTNDRLLHLFRASLAVVCSCCLDLLPVAGVGSWRRERERVWREYGGTRCGNGLITDS